MPFSIISRNPEEGKKNIANLINPKNSDFVNQPKGEKKKEKEKDNGYSHLFIFSPTLFLSFCQDVHAIQLDQSKVRSGHDLENPDTFLYQQVTYIKFPNSPQQHKKL